MASIKREAKRWAEFKERLVQGLIEAHGAERMERERAASRCLCYALDGGRCSACSRREMVEEVD